MGTITVKDGTTIIKGLGKRAAGGVQPRLALSADASKTRCCFLRPRLPCIAMTAAAMPFEPTWEARDETLRDHLAQLVEKPT